MTYVQGLGLKVTGAAYRRFTNSRITRVHEAILRGRTASSGFLGEHVPEDTIDELVTTLARAVAERFVQEILNEWQRRSPDEKRQAEVSMGGMARSGLTVPEIKFSEWFPWEERQDIPGSTNLPGIYLTAHFSEPPSGIADPRTEEVAYVGLTCDQTIRKRLNQFDRAARNGTRGHAGGVTYYQKFGGDMEGLFTSAFTPTLDKDELTAAFIRHVERKLIWEYSATWGRRPVCNSQ